MIRKDFITVIKPYKIEEFSSHGLLKPWRLVIGEFTNNGHVSFMILGNNNWRAVFGLGSSGCRSIVRLIFRWSHVAWCVTTAMNCPSTVPTASNYRSFVGDSFIPTPHVSLCQASSSAQLPLPPMREKMDAPNWYSLPAFWTRMQKWM